MFCPGGEYQTATPTPGRQEWHKTHYAPYREITAPR
jgi:hypothetical protein